MCRTEKEHTSMAIGSIFDGGLTSRYDEATGYRIIKPIADDRNRHMYFTSNPFTKSGHEMVFTAVRDGVENFYLLDYNTGKYVQLTDMSDLQVSKAHYDKVRDTLYFSTRTEVYAVNVFTLETKKVYTSKNPLGSICVTCDGRYLITQCSLIHTHLNNDKNPIEATYYRMIKVDLNTLEESTILYRSTRIDHIQCNPTDPDYIMYCEWGYMCTHHRIWYTNLDGTKGGPVGPEMPNEHRVHEYFTPDGKQIAYHGKFFKYDNEMNLKNIDHTWGIMDVDGGNDKYWSCKPRGKQAGHSIMSSDGSMIVADGDDNISLVKRYDDGTAIFEPLVAHNSSMSGNFVHPHPSFSSDDRYIVFATDNKGADGGNIYLIDLYSKKNDSLLKKIAAYTVDKANTTTEQEAAADKDARRYIRWDWSMGVGFYGVLKAIDTIQDKTLSNGIQNGIKKWIDARLDGIENICVNTCGVMPAVLSIGEIFGFDAYDKIIGEFDDYVRNKALRTPCGAIAHSVIGSELPGQIWADTLFMCVLYMAERGVMTGDYALVSEAVNQLELHIAKLHDPKTDLFYHGYDDINNHHMGALWGRGNAWVAVSTVEILSMIDMNALGVADSAKVRNVLGYVDRQLTALAGFQNENGTWNTVIDCADTYEEASVTAGIAYAVARGVGLGFFNAAHLGMAKKAFAALADCVEATGSISKGSTGTPIKENPAAYNDIPYHETPFTQGLGLLALSVV